MKSRWLINLALLVVVVGVALALYLAPQPKQEQAVAIQVSSLAPAQVSSISIEFPAKKPMELKKRDGRWFLTQPLAVRAGQGAVDQVLSILTATSVDKFDASDPARYGLDHPALVLKLDAETFNFGTYNPVSGKQYVGNRNSVYLVDSKYSEAAAIQVVEMIDKNLLAPDEQIAGFDFSRLEQWEDHGLKLDLDKGQWKVSRADAKPKQDELNAWFGDSWGTLIAMSVEPYKPDSRSKYPSFEIRLKNGKTLHFDKQSESPELILARPDEGLRYHFPQDVGFQILNPPIGVPK
jgi:hypothetical protein